MTEEKFIALLDDHLFTSHDYWGDGCAGTGDECQGIASWEAWLSHAYRIMSRH